ncbi:CotH kinase family protein [Jeotgalibaca sp. MA1X17-3]|uniref:CotH kinase family protein n=1 Tax=Jeotgalibaca sp. MA1X17-3 TaxID=2908211 RepID=UPI001F1BADC3|nr:CotH kinase family protein [Jeotgalibaca sp. MA1X17-3]UJF15413.1 CotH kinase family protein [Jeotgalibaca sp. MA1X17-3]
MKHTKFIRKKRKKYGVLYVMLMIALFFLIISVYQSSPTSEVSVNQPFISGTDSRQHNLPIMVIDTNGEEIEPSLERKEAEVNGMSRNLFLPTEKYAVQMKLYEPNLYSEQLLSQKITPTLESDLIINIRGQSSLKYDKKQYTIRLIDDYKLENAQPLLGMKSHDKWVLNGMYSDKSLIRNYLAYKMGRDIMDYAPDTRFVEVYLKDTDEDLNFEDHYRGVYLLTEKIERDENRIAIDKNSDEYKDISFIVARDKIKYGDPVLTTDWSTLEEDFVLDAMNNIKARTVFTTNYPSKSNMTDLFEQQIIDYINKFEYSLRSSNFEDTREGYRKYIDVDSFIKYAMINEITRNIDGGEVSTYFYKDIGGLLQAGPIWDFDQSLGNTPIEEANEPTGFRMVDVIWYERLFQDEAFAKRYKTMYKQYRNTIWSDRNVDKMIDEALLILGESTDRNRERWFPKDSKQDFNEEIEQLRVFLKKRLNWMDKNINLINRVKENAVE